MLLVYSEQLHTPQPYTVCVLEAATLHCAQCTYVACVMFITAQCQNGNVHAFTVCVHTHYHLHIHVTDMQKPEETISLETWRKSAGW